MREHIITTRHEGLTSGDAMEKLRSFCAQIGAHRVIFPPYSSDKGRANFWLKGYRGGDDWEELVVICKEGQALQSGELTALYEEYGYGGWADNSSTSGAAASVQTSLSGGSTGDSV